VNAADLPVSALMWQRHAFARASLRRQHELAERAVAVDRFAHVAEIVAGIPEGCLTAPPRDSLHSPRN
jgi:hypothetical protein